MASAGALRNFRKGRCLVIKYSKARFASQGQSRGSSRYILKIIDNDHPYGLYLTSATIHQDTGLAIYISSDRQDAMVGSLLTATNLLHLIRDSWLDVKVAVVEVGR
jgi:hypothetical protein